LCGGAQPIACGGRKDPVGWTPVLRRSAGERRGRAGSGRSSIAIACIAFACVFGGALLGALLRTVLPEEHLSTDTKDVVKLGIALIATMAALVFSLLILSAKGTYDTRGNQLLQVSADIMLLDRVLARYGPETKDARAMLQRSVAAAIERFWPANRDQPETIDPRASPVEALYDKVQELSPQTEVQRSLQSQASTIALDLGRMRVLLFERLGSSIPVHLGKKRGPPRRLGVALKPHCRQRQLLHPPTQCSNPPRQTLYYKGSRLLQRFPRNATVAVTATPP
jgi:hypothetical protein